MYDGSWARFLSVLLSIITFHILPSVEWLQPWVIYTAYLMYDIQQS